MLYQYSKQCRVATHFQNSIFTTSNGKDFDTVKVRASVKKISPDDIIVRRKGVLRVINKKKPKNKQRQG